MLNFKDWFRLENLLSEGYFKTSMEVFYYLLSEKFIYYFHNALLLYVLQMLSKSSFKFQIVKFEEE